MPSRKTLYLHIGHGKTGSSYIQSSLALSMERLAAHGLAYPRPASWADASRGRITSGNGKRLLDHLEKGSDPPDGLEGAHEGIVLSFEGLFRWLLQAEAPARLHAFMEAHGFQTLRMLLFIREPVAHAASSYQQTVKRGGSSRPMEEYFASYERPAQVLALLRQFEGRPETRFDVRNYSAHRDGLLDVVECWLEVPAGTLAMPPVEVVNRSLTGAELELQRQLNRHWGDAAGRVADALCNRLPDIPADAVRPPLEVQEALWERLAPAIGEINHRIPEPERLDRARDIVDTPSADDCRHLFTSAQLAVIAETMASLARKPTVTRPVTGEGSESIWRAIARRLRASS